MRIQLFVEYTPIRRNEIALVRRGSTEEMIVNHSAPKYLLLLLATLPFAAVKVPAGVSALSFYGTSLVAAVVLLAVAAALGTWALARYVAGFALVATMLSMAIFMLATLPPYVAPAQ